MDLAELRTRVADRSIESVVVGFTDHYGRTMGKRFDAEFFVDSCADDGTHGFFVARFERQPHGEAQSQGQGRRCEASTADAAAKSVEPHKKKRPRMKKGSDIS